MKRRTMILSVVALVLMLALAGCGNVSVGDGSAQDAVCGALTSVSTAVGQLDGVNAEATVAEVKELKTKADGAVEKVRTANKALNAEPINELLASYDSMSATIDGLDDDAAIGDTLAEVQGAVAGVTAALDQASSTLKCGQ